MRHVVSGTIFDWELIDGNKLITMKPSGTALMTDMTEALSLALAGIGIAYVVELLARPYLGDGSLKWLLPQTAVQHDGAFLYYPRRASLAPKLRAFIDEAKKTHQLGFAVAAKGAIGVLGVQIVEREARALVRL